MFQHTCRSFRICNLLRGLHNGCTGTALVGRRPRSVPVRPDAAVSRGMSVCSERAVSHDVADSPSSAVVRSRWQLHAAVCIERRPLVAAQLTALEQQYLQHLSQLELRQSLLSDHEMRFKRDLMRAEAVRGADGDDVELDEESSLQTAQDFEDACMEELKAFNAETLTDTGEASDDVRSLSRLPDRSLVLVVQQQLGVGTTWMLPQCLHQPGQTLRQTAEAAVQQIFGGNANVKVLGNAPWGFHRYSYPKPLQDATDHTGAKVFFYKAYLEGDVGSISGVNDYMWLNRQELRQNLSTKYRRAVSSFLLSDQ